MVISVASTGCWCHSCNIDRRLSNGMLYTASVFIVCPDCGNKRCPKATYHALPCTNSNEPGQPGSRYT
jgi:hypothetical protein